jgi:hypothetical protein
MTLNLPLFKIFAGFVVVGILAGLIWQNRSLSTQAERLKNDNQTLKQQNASYKDSLEQIGKYESESGSTRTVSEKADRPVEIDTVYVPEPIDSSSSGEVDRKTTATISLDSVEVSGDTTGVNQGKYWEYNVRREAGFYNTRLLLTVYPPGDSLSYRLNISTDKIDVGLYNYTDEYGINQTSIDVPDEINVSGVQSYYQPDPPAPTNDNFQIIPVSGVGAPKIGLGAGAGFEYQKDLFWGIQFESSVTINTPVVEPDGIDVPTVYPLVTTKFSF